MRRAGDAYLQELAAALTGPPGERKRLVDEVRDHIEDAVAADVRAGVAAEEAERRAVERLGAPAATASAWRARCALDGGRRRRRVGVLALAVAAAAVLAVTQHADGRQGPSAPASACDGTALAAAAPDRCSRSQPAGQRQDDGR